VVLDFNHKEGPVKVQEKAKKKDKRNGEKQSSKRNSKPLETRVEEESNNDYESYTHTSTSQATSPSTASTLEVKDLRKTLEEKSKKYSHLPVYDRQEELKKAKEREAKMSAIMSDMDRNLGAVTNLTSSHMESKGVTMVPTPFDEESDPKTQKQSMNGLHISKSEQIESRETAAIKSTSKSQGEISKSDNKTVNTSKYIKEENSIIVRTSIKDNQTNIVSESRKEALNISSATNAKNELPGETNSELNLSSKKSDIPKESLAKDSKEVVDHRKPVPVNLTKEEEIPFADDPEEGEDYTKQTRITNGFHKTNPSKEHERSSSWRFMKMK